MTLREEQKRRTRRAILDAALELSAQKGFSGVSLREVAAGAGIAAPSIYRHFAGLEDLGLALVDEIGLLLRKLIRDARSRVYSGEASVTRASIETFMEYIGENGNLFRLLLGEASGSYPAFRTAIQKEVSRFVDDLGDDLHRASKVGGRPVANIPVTAEAMTVLTFGMGAQAIDCTEEQRRELTERIITQVRLIMRGAEAEAHGWDPGTVLNHPNAYD